MSCPLGNKTIVERGEGGGFVLAEQSAEGSTAYPQTWPAQRNVEKAFPSKKGWGEGAD